MRTSNPMAPLPPTTPGRSSKLPFKIVLEHRPNHTFEHGKPLLHFLARNGHPSKLALPRSVEDCARYCLYRSKDVRDRKKGLPSASATQQLANAMSSQPFGGFAGKPNRAEQRLPDDSPVYFCGRIGVRDPPVELRREPTVSGAPSGSLQLCKETQELIWKALRRQRFSIHTRVCPAFRFGSQVHPCSHPNFQ